VFQCVIFFQGTFTDLFTSLEEIQSSLLEDLPDREPMPTSSGNDKVEKLSKISIIIVLLVLYQNRVTLLTFLCLSWQFIGGMQIGLYFLIVVYYLI
jgi:hypothetical protein